MWWIYLFFLWKSAGLALAAETGALGPCDSWFTANTHPRGVVVITHGMNLKPSRMNELAEAIAADGYEVFRPAFTGHCGTNEKYLHVTSQEWEADARRIYSIARHRADVLGKPLDLIAYSFSALIFQTLSDSLAFERKIYFAPALAVKFWYPAGIWLAGIWPDFTFHSLSPEGYVANAESGVRSALALDAFVRRWQAGEGAADTAPTLVWVDPDDELVDAKHLQALPASMHNWQVREVSNRGSSLPRKYHHLIIDSAALGASEWTRVVSQSTQFLEGGALPATKNISLGK